MKTVNVYVREEVEAFYSLDAFVHDAGQNTQAKAVVRHGIRILSAPDDDGKVRMSRGQHHVGDAAPNLDALFLCPYRTEGTVREDASGYGAESQEERVPSTPEESYRDFIDRVVEAAKEARFPDAIGMHDVRLKGFHGG